MSQSISGIWPERIENHTYLASGLSPDALVFDLGLNEGNFASEIIRRHGCRVIGCEPVSMLYDALPRHARLTALRAAAGGEDGSAEIRIYADHCASLNPVDGGVATGTETVPVLSLHSLLEKAGGRPVALMKVDIEGAECPLIEKASEEDLLRIDQYTIEFHDFMMPQLRVQTDRIINRMRDLRYRFIDFSRVRGDVLFIREDLIGAPAFAMLAGPYKYAIGARRLMARLAARPAPR